MTGATWDHHAVLDRLPAPLLRTRDRGAVGVAMLVVRLAAGLPLVLFGIGKFTSYGSEVTDFRHYGLPLPEAAVVLAGIVEVVGGAAIVAGFLTRLAAGVVALNLLVALLTAGLVDGGTFHLVVGPVLLAACVVLVVLGGGTLSADARLLARPGDVSRR